MTSPKLASRRIAGGLGFVLAIALLWIAAFLFDISVSRTAAPIDYRPAHEPARITQLQVSDRPRNVIVFVADGFGFAHLALSLHTGGEDSVWKKFPVRGWHHAGTAKGPVTDSAASATAMATGTLTRPDYVGVDADGKALPTLFEQAWRHNYATGIVTDSYIWDGTPAAFVTHDSDRDNAASILRQLADVPLDVLFGELEDVGEDAVPEWDDTIALLTQRYLLLDEDLQIPSGTAPDQPLLFVCPEDAIEDLDSIPSLPAMTRAALDRLDTFNKPILMLVESEEMDSASHQWDAERAVNGLAAIAATLEIVLEFAVSRGDTLVLFTSDHETGGLALGYDVEDYPNVLPIWSTRHHTSTLVPLLAIGPGANEFSDVQRVWEIGDILMAMTNEGSESP